MKPVINKRKCPAESKMCKPIQVCPTAALSYVTDENEPLGGKIVVDQALCNECGLCVDECCGHAIEMV
jgi:Pyruvate/2-oxoacid:ferredoxin oxidoreductase delta subunit